MVLKVHQPSPYSYGVSEFYGTMLQGIIKRMQNIYLYPYTSNMSGDIMYEFISPYGIFYHVDSICNVNNTVTRCMVRRLIILTLYVLNSPLAFTITIDSGLFLLSYYYIYSQANRGWNFISVHICKPCVELSLQSKEYPNDLTLLNVFSLCGSHFILI